MCVTVFFLFKYTTLPSSLVRMSVLQSCHVRQHVPAPTTITTPITKDKWVGASACFPILKITFKVMAPHVMRRKIFLTATSPSCPQLVSKCKDVLSAHANLNVEKYTQTHSNTSMQRGVKCFEWYCTLPLNQL